VRRGDLKSKDCARMISEERYSRVFENLAPLMSKIQKQWEAEKSGQRLRFRVHIMSDSSTLDEKAVEHWRDTFAQEGADMRLYLRNDTFLTMHHLIAADVLIMPQSGFVAAAAMFSVGVKLFFDYEDYYAADSVARLADCKTVHSRVNSTRARKAHVRGVHPEHAGLRGINVERPGLEDQQSSADFLCQLYAHLRWKFRAHR
jgi:hypothetical protein